LVIAVRDRVWGRLVLDREHGDPRCKMLTEALDLFRSTGQ